MGETTKPICDDKLKLIIEHGHPYGIRDSTGYLFFFTKISKFDGQDQRYRDEIAGRFRLADFLLEALQATQSSNLRPSPTSESGPAA